ncbi:MAG: ABC transporter permease [Chitinophagaceae bacterium]|nr:ABC transporter permease [Chitinophagaceae bacterium]MCA6515901.1 ABC transporter permease [Chitinophagaceae bacterium]
MLIKIAWRNIWRNRGRSIIIILSVGIGLFCGILVLSIYKGMMSSRVKTVIETETGSLQIHHPGFKSDYEAAYVLQQDKQLLAELRKTKEITAYSFRTITQGMLAASSGSTGVQINGIDLSEEATTSGLINKIKDTTELHWGKKYPILIGKKLAQKMRLKKGSKLVLTFTDSSTELVSAAFRVAAVYESDNAPLDEKNVYIKKTELNELLGIGDASHELAMIIGDDKKTATIHKQLEKSFPDLKTENWRELSPETDLMVNTVDVYSYIIIVIIMLALSFGIINTMLMAVLERTKEIGMIMALGMNKIKLFWLILLETVFLTLAGLPIGWLFSWIVINYYHNKGIDWSGMGKEMMSSFGFSTTIYPQFPSEQIFPIILIVVATALLSCIIPAIRALRLQPVDALRK